MTAPGEGMRLDSCTTFASGRCDSRFSSRWAFSWWAFALTAATMPISATAQTDATIRGRVITLSGSDVEGARVDLEGHGVTETSAAGSFRFERVALGEYSLRVTAIGYAPALLSFAVRGDTTVTVRLTPVGYRLDSVVVTARRIDVQGLVQDPARDLAVRDADVFTNQVPPIRTNGQGRFRLKDVWEGSPLAVSIAAFGYLPMDTILLPADGDRYVFDLAPDPVIERMIAHQIERINQRSRGRLSVLMRPLDREALLRSGGGSLREILKARYSIHLRRLGCIVVDDQPLPPFISGAMLDAMNPVDIERVEVLFRGAMLRIYTRNFIRRMISRPVQLPPIVEPPPCL